MTARKQRRAATGIVTAIVVPIATFAIAVALISVSSRNGTLPIIDGVPTTANPVTTADPGVDVTDTTNPFADADLYVPDDSLSAKAAARAVAGSADASVLTRLSEVPTAVWLTPEEFPARTVSTQLRSIITKADGQLPTFVLYGIPDRDCGNFSAGGLSESEYPTWVSQIATALDGSGAVVIVEPDALPLARECGNLDQRIQQIGTDVDILSATDATVYLDAGHSTWLPAGTIAPILRSAGVGKVRGFATNVSNYNSDSDEIAFAQAVSSQLGGAHFVIDSGRNGVGSNGEWCNPVGRALGTEPAETQTGTGQDAYLWIKPPGESDGTCNGGPAAGEWWLENALSLAQNAGWN